MTQFLTPQAHRGDGDLADWSIACYPKPQTLLEMIMESLSGTSSVMAGTPFAPVEKAYKDWNWNSSERIYARMPYIRELNKLQTNQTGSPGCRFDSLTTRQ